MEYDRNNFCPEPWGLDRDFKWLANANLAVNQLATAEFFCDAFAVGRLRTGVTLRINNLSS
jgi:hypothetical protein